MEAMDENAEYEMSKICRSCRRDDQDLEPIFTALRGDEVTLFEMLTTCTQIQVNYGDELPQNLCSRCVKDINTAYNFRKVFEQSDYILREYISRRNVEDEELGAFNRSVVKVEEPEVTIVESDPLFDERYTGAHSLGSMKHEGAAKGWIKQIGDDELDAADVVSATLGHNSDDSEESDYYDKSDAFMRSGNASSLEDSKHVPTKSRECPICNRSFNRNHHLTRHIKTHDNDIHCEHCPTRFSGRAYQDYKDHMEAKHPGMEVLPQRSKEKRESKPLEVIIPKKTTEAICRICDANFSRIAELRNHLKTHENPASLANVRFSAKPYLFEDGRSTVDCVSYIVRNIKCWNVLRFYQIMEPDGEELELSDSDSEAEEGTTPVEGTVHRQHKCELCNQSFSRIKMIMEHATDQHSAEGLLCCRHCTRGFPNGALLVRHLKQQCENTLKKFYCVFCDEKFMWQTSLNKHALTKHKPTKPPETLSIEDAQRKRFFCPACDKSFGRMEHLRRHATLHNPASKKFECPHCHKKFNRKDNLGLHMKIHQRDPLTGTERSHLCVYCGKGFGSQYNLTVHMRRHTGDRPYKCDICAKGFPRSLDLQCHRRTHTGEKPFGCNVCGKAFSRSYKLHRHKRIHTGSRPYQCTYCDRAFTQSNDLTLHIRRHTGEKPYVCTICNERFIQGTALRVHQRATGHFDDSVDQPVQFPSSLYNMDA